MNRLKEFTQEMDAMRNRSFGKSKPPSKLRVERIAAQAVVTVKRLAGGR